VRAITAHPAITNNPLHERFAPATEEAVRFGAYVAALDEEQIVAAVYVASRKAPAMAAGPAPGGGAVSLARRSADGYCVSA
jgi:hypothetical protein